MIFQVQSFLNVNLSRDDPVHAHSRLLKCKTERRQLNAGDDVPVAGEGERKDACAQLRRWCSRRCVLRRQVRHGAAVLIRLTFTHSDSLQSSAGLHSAENSGTLGFRSGYISL